MNLNLSASVNIFKLLARPSLCLPHATVSTFDDLPVPLNKLAIRNGKPADIRAVVLDKDDCFAYPDRSEVCEAYQVDRPPSFAKFTAFSFPCSFRMHAKEIETLRGVA
jgi:phosphatidylglycerophosphatase GEP4